MCLFTEFKKKNVNPSKKMQFKKCICSKVFKTHLLFLKESPEGLIFTDHVMCHETIEVPL